MRRFDKVIFAYNGRVERDEKGHYYGNELNDIIVERYRKLAERVVFLVRVKPLSKTVNNRVLPFLHSFFSVVELDNFSGIVSYFINYRKRKRLIEKEIKDADIIVARLPSSIGRMAVASAKKYNKPYLVEVVGCPWDALWNHSIVGKLVAPVAFFKMKRIVAKSPFVIYVTSHFLQKRYPNKYRNIGISDVVVKAIDNEILSERQNRVENFSTKGIISIGTIAGIDVPYKGHTDVLKAIWALKKEGYTIKYYIIGKGEGRTINDLIKGLHLEDDVLVIGEVSHELIGNYIRKFDIYIQPSKMEGLPRAVVEALSFACPVIGSNAGGIPELISKRMIFSKGDIKGLCVIIGQLTTEILKEESVKNYFKSKEFLQPILDIKRNDFYEEFLKSISN